MRRTQEGYSPFKDDKAKDTENSPFEASSVLVAKANNKTDRIFSDSVRFYYRKNLCSGVSLVINLSYVSVHKLCIALS